MYSKKVNAVSAFLLAALVIAVSCEAATHGLPPFYGESPSARLVDGPIVGYAETREDVNYRLPNTTEPVHYDVELTTNVHNVTRRFTGTVKILLKAIESTRTIVLHARQLQGYNAVITNANETNGAVEQLSISYEEQREFLSLTPQNQSLTFTRGTFWVLTITYEGVLRDDNAGFYLSTYTDEAGRERYLATTQFESTDARHAFPCYDEPAKRATFSIIINHSDTFHAISNMPLDEQASRPGYSVFQKTVNMPTYLVAFIVSEFVYTEAVLNGLPQRVYTRPGTTQDQEFALVSGLLLVKRLADYYQVDFALPKIDQVGVPDFAAGAMENWGLVTYREQYMLYNKNTSTTNTQTNIASTIAHEYCHQWFGNLVAVRWWTYLWLKEGFATLFSYQAMDEAYPEWDVYQNFLIDDYQRALTSDGTGNMNPMTHYVQTPSEISARYDSISYSKAGSVLYMWQSALGNEVFRQGLHLYLTANQFSSAEEGQLFESLGIAAGAQNIPLPATMSAMFSSWSQQRSYPLLTVTRNYNTNSFTVTQEAFFDNSTLTSDNLWYIPLNYAHKSNPDYRNTSASHYLLKTKQIQITDTSLDANDWLLLNKQSTGYYRVNYDKHNWELIIDALKSKPYKFHPRNRGQLIHDAYKFSSTGRLDQSVLLSLLQYLPHEDQYAPWSTASAVITTFNRYLNGDKDYPNFQIFAASLVTDLFDKLGVNDIPGEQHLVKFTRNVAINLACMAGIPSCLEETNNKLKAFIDNGVAVEPNLQTQIYCNGLRQSGDAVFDFIYNLVLDSDDQALRRSLVTSLGCSQTESQLQKFVHSSIDNTVPWRTQERITLLSAAYSGNSVGLMVSIDFLNENWVAYSNLNPGFGGANPLNEAMLGIANYIVSEQQRTKYLELLDKVKGSNAVQANLEEVAKANIRSNFAWLETNRNPIMSWVNTYAGSAGSGSVALSASFVFLFPALAVVFTRYF